jgi:hypothetical protein
MIVLFNVKITDVKMTHPYAGTVYDRASWFPVSNRFDIFKYCLASRAVMAPVVDKFIFYIDLAEFTPRQAELEEFMLSIFPPDKIEIHWYRIDRTQKWRTLCDEQFINDNELIWYEGNDDHIFIDSNLDVIRASINILNADPDPLAAMYYSHWPEQMRMSLLHNGELTSDGNFIKFHWDTVDSLLMMKAGRFKKYWFDTDCGEDNMYRSDSLGWQYGLKIPGTVYSPTKELIRHYDGYSHVGNLLGTIAPPLFVPIGFLDHNMKVRIGYPERKEGWTNLYAATERLYSIDPHGAEHRWCVEDIPLFWKPYISELDINIDQDIHILKQARDAAFLSMTKIPMKAHGHVFNYECHPKEWFTKHLLSAKIIT